MQHLLRWCFVVLTATGTVGCSGLGNVGIGPGSNEPTGGSFAPFGGVQSSSARVSDGFQSITTKGLQFYIPVVSETMGLACLVDVPLSLAVDVVTLPVCYYYRSTFQPAATLPDRSLTEAIPVPVQPVTER